MSGTAEEMSAIDQFNDQLHANGYWVMAAGLGAPDTARLVDGRKDSQIENFGSLFNTPEFYSGFWIIDVPTENVALELTFAGSTACNRKVELRPFLN